MVHRRDENPELWDLIKEVLEVLGARGMSDDETDQDDHGRKILLHTVDSYKIRHDADPFLRKDGRGTQPLRRDRTARRVSDSLIRRPIRSMPLNWYDGDWYLARFLDLL